MFAIRKSIAVASLLSVVGCGSQCSNCETATKTDKPASTAAPSVPRKSTAAAAHDDWEKSPFQSTSATATTTFDDVKKSATDYIDSATDRVKASRDAAIQNVSDRYQASEKAVTDKVAELKKQASENYTASEQAVNSKIAELRQQANNATGATRDKYHQMANDLETHKKTLADRVKNAEKNTGNAFKHLGGGLKNALHKFGDDLESAVNKIDETAPK